MRRRYRRGWFVALFLWLVLDLSACSHWPGFNSDIAAVKLILPIKPAEFRIDGRISVQAGEKSFSGGLVWSQVALVEELLLRSPLGQGIAEIRGGASGMELKDSEGRLSYAADADALVQKALGLELPLAGMAWWVVGLPRPGVTYKAMPDADGRLAELKQDGWQIFFSRYQPHNGQFYPGKLIARRGDDLEVRLVIDTWGEP